MSNQESPTAIIHLGDTKHIEPGKTYSIEIEQLAPIYANEIENIIRTFEEATGAKAVVVQGAKVKDLGVVTMPVEELRKLTEAIHRVRELHKPRAEKVYQTKTTCYPDGTRTEIEEDVTVCDWCQYLVDFQRDYSYGVAPYPCPTIKALDGER